MITGAERAPQGDRFSEPGLSVGVEDPKLPVKDPNHAPIRLTGVCGGNGGNVEMPPRSSSDSRFPPVPLRMGGPEVLRAGARMLSSSLLSYRSYRGLEGVPRARDRTTSPLHMGQVRLLVVSQGVLLLLADPIHPTD